MPRHFPLLVLLTVVTPFITLNFTIGPYLDRATAHEPAPRHEQQKATTGPDKPDFTSIDSMPDRKSQFFDFIEKYVAQRNKEILRLRYRLARNEVGPKELKALAQQYRVKPGGADEMRQKLLKKVDVVPASLVLAQAALESAWGTSRFAAMGNNFFGQWCFTNGCGMVPDKRLEGKSHEVKVFDSPFDSVASYIRNLNSHPAYRHFRERRAELRAEHKPLNGCYLARGLTNYSARGDAYVESIKLMIRANQLEHDPNDYCAPVAVAKDEPAASTAPESPPKKQTLAADQAQSETQQPQPAANDQPPSG